MGRIAILGAGPIGLEAALAALERGRECTVYERAASVGGHVRRWGHVRMFTPWSWNVSPRARAAVTGLPDGDELPTGHELADRLLEPLAAAPPLAGRIRLGTTVVGVAREGLLKHEAIGERHVRRRPFRILVRGPDGAEAIEHADVVIDATGAYGVPNRLGDGGIDAVNERAFEDRIERFLPDVLGQPREWAGRTILLTGAGHSAQTAVRELARLAARAPETHVVWAVRSANPDWGAVAVDPLHQRAALARDAANLAAGTSAAVEVRRGSVTEALRERDGRVVVTLRNHTLEEVTVDRIVALNGGVGDASLYRQLQVHECYATSGPINLAAALLAHAGSDCLGIEPAGPQALANPEPGFFILGAKSYGRNSQFLLRTGWQQVDDVFLSLLG